MFKNEFQGANYFEIFNPSVKDPLANCKLVGPSGIQKLFDKDCKGSVYQLEGTPSTTKISIPKDPKQGLSLVQRCLVFQVNLKTSSQEFSLEIGLTDLSQNRRTLLFSTSHKELSVQPLSARIPMKYLNRSQWTNLVFDLAALISELWKNQTLKTIDYLSVCANCKLRRVFTLKALPSAEYDESTENPFAAVDFPQGTESKLQVFNLNELKSNENSDTMTNVPLDASIGASSSKSSKSSVFKIAFGTKVPVGGQSTPVQGHQQLKSAKSHTQIDHDLNDSSLKVNHISPLSLSNGHIQPSGATTNGHSSRTKSESENPHSLGDSGGSKLAPVKPLEGRAKSSTNQRSSASSTKSTSKQPSSRTPAERADDSASNLNNESHLSFAGAETPASRTVREQMPVSPKANGRNPPSTSASSISNSNKIPHPPQSTRPTSTSARKMRLASAAKLQNQNNAAVATASLASQQQSPQKSSGNLLKPHSSSNQSNMQGFAGGGGESSNEEDINNNSSKTVFEYIVPLKGSNASKQNGLLPRAGDQAAASHLNVSNDNSVLSSMLNESLGAYGQKKLNGAGSKNSSQQLEDSGSMVYSFSSKPKPVPSAKDDRSSLISPSINLPPGQAGQKSANGYDYRKYASKSSQKTTSTPPSNANSTNGATSNFSSKSSTQFTTPKSSAATANRNMLSMVKDSINPVEASAAFSAFSKTNGNHEAAAQHNDLIDSFEARMLKEMKAEMDSNTTSTSKNSRNSSKKLEPIENSSSHPTTSSSAQNRTKSSDNKSTSKPAVKPVTVTKNVQAAFTTPALNRAAEDAVSAKSHLTLPTPNNDIQYPKSPDVEFFEALQRETSGIQSPFSDDNTHTTSEKYNFDAMTSSIEDTTTSFSKKTTNRKTKLDESNNYQDEMNMSLVSNLPAKSINLKDLPAKYSPLSNAQPIGSNKLQKSPITEEPIQYDDSQADIDEMDSGSDEEVDLLYDSALNCYYDPKTGNYYEIDMG